jgi:hypothetical protein
MSEVDEKCLRCKNKAAVFICVNCDSFKLLCTQCDSYVHGLPSKKKHKRNVVLVDKNSSENMSEIKNYERKNLKNYKSKNKICLYN